MKKSKILVLTTTFPRWKGDITPSFVYELSKRLQDYGFEIIVLAPHHKGAKKFEIMDGMKVYRFQYFWPAKYQKLAYGGGILPNLKRSWLAKIQLPLLFLAELLQAIRIVRKERIDVIHSHWIVPNGLVGAICRKIFKIEHITTAHAGDVFTLSNSNYLKKIGSFVLRNSQIITANSRYTREAVIAIDNSAENRVLIIPMGVDTSKFNPKKRNSNLKEKYEAEHLILSVGRLVEKKGINYLIIAMKDVVKYFPNAKLIIGGSGPERENLEDLTRSIGLDSNVIFVGYIDDSELPVYYASCDLFVLPSVKTKEGDTEGLGVVLLEAMASGTPVIGSDIGGIKDIIEDGTNGLLAKPQDPEDLAEKIIKLLKDSELRHKLSEEGMKTIKEKFSWEIVAKKFADTIMKVIK